VEGARVLKRSVFRGINVQVTAVTQLEHRPTQFFAIDSHRFSICGYPSRCVKANSCTIQITRNILYVLRKIIRDSTKRRLPILPVNSSLPLILGPERNQDASYHNEEIANDVSAE